MGLQQNADKFPHNCSMLFMFLISTKTGNFTAIPCNLWCNSRLINHLVTQFHQWFHDHPPEGNVVNHVARWRHDVMGVINHALDQPFMLGSVAKLCCKTCNLPLASINLNFCPAFYSFTDLSLLNSARLLFLLCNTMQSKQWLTNIPLKRYYFRLQ